MPAAATTCAGASVRSRSSKRTLPAVLARMPVTTLISVVLPAPFGPMTEKICPGVTDSEKLEVASAEETFARLEADELSGLRLGLLHGRLPAAEKEATMAAFRDGQIQVLVATTVIEVGVDVPNATVMVILDADRFGIAQLHQLRGRVGRGAAASHCVLVATGEPTPDGQSRLEAITQTLAGMTEAGRDDTGN